MYETQGIRLSEFSRSNSKLSLDEFKSTYTKPFLLVEKAADGNAENIDTVSPADDAVLTKTTFAEANPINADEQYVFQIDKPGGTQFSRMVNVGRTRNNDIMINHSSISKFHAFFKYDSAFNTYAITDAGSKNGTSMSAKELKPYKSEPIQSRQVIIFGKSIRAIFLLPEDFYRYLGVQRKIYHIP